MFVAGVRPLVAKLRRSGMSDTFRSYGAWLKKESARATNIPLLTELPKQLLT